MTMSWRVIFRLYLRSCICAAGSPNRVASCRCSISTARTSPLPIVRRCLDRGWAEPWFNNPLKPDWLVCKLTQPGRRLGAAP